MALLFPHGANLEPPHVVKTRLKKTPGLREQKRGFSADVKDGSRAGGKKGIKMYPLVN